MRTRSAVAVVAMMSGVLVSIGHAQNTQPARTSPALADAVAAMGSTLVGNVQFTATGSAYAMGQSFRPDGPWPAFKLASYKLDIDYILPAMRADLVRTNPDGPVQGGGGLPLIGPQRQVQSLRGTTAWNMDDLNGANATAAAAGDRTLTIWTSPHGVIKAAQKAGADLQVATRQGADGRTVTVLTFPAGGTIVTATLNAENLVARVETKADNPVLGDVTSETVYEGYKDAKQISLTPVHPEDLTGVMFPTHIVQKQGGFAVLDLTVTTVHPNAYMVFPLPAPIARASASPAPAAPAPARVDIQKIGDGVYYLTGGTHNSVAVEFKDYVVLVEAPLNDDRAAAVLSKLHETIPNKPVRFVVNTHHHFDHSGGLRAAVAAGATIVTQAGNRSYYQKIWMQPHTIANDRMGRSGRKPAIEAVDSKRVWSDGTRSLEVHRLEGSSHADTMLIAYVPKEKLLIEADVFNPPPANAPAGAPNREAANLAQNIQRLRLDVQQIAPLHGRLVTIDDLLTAGRGAGVATH
jgi:glyoxylase-like metal-dependent hydrolase (beta-lactamase superfamily II)